MTPDQQVQAVTNQLGQYTAALTVDLTQIQALVASLETETLSPAGSAALVQVSNRLQAAIADLGTISSGGTINPNPSGPISSE